MKTPKFLIKLSSLTSLPEGKRARARAIGKDLTDEQRGELLEELEEANGKLKEIEEEEQELSDESEFLLADFEKLINKTEREMEEEDDHEEDLKSIEQKLSSDSTQ